MKRMKQPGHPLVWSLLPLLLGASSLTHADGAQIYRDRGCVACHGVDGRTPLNENFPSIAGQTRGYLYNQMTDFRADQRAGGLAPLMANTMAGLSDQELEALAIWLAGQ